MAAVQPALLQVKNKEQKVLQYRVSKSDYDETYKLFKSNMKIVGMRLGCKDSILARRFWTIFYWLSFTNAFVMAGLMTGFIVDAARRKDINEYVMKMIPCVGYLLMSMTKSYKIEYYRPVFENLVSTLRDMWPEGNVDDEEHHIIRSAMKGLNFVVKGYYYVTVWFEFCAFGPKTLTAIMHQLDEDEAYELPFNYWSPPGVELEKNRLIPFTQLVQGISASRLIMCGDLLLLIILQHITMQFDVLSAKIQKIFSVPVDHQLVPTYPLAKYSTSFEEDDPMRLRNEWEDKYLKEIKEIVKKHITLFELTRDLDSMYGFALFIHFLNASMIISFCGVCVMFLEKWNDAVFKGFCVISLVQAGLISWYGQKIIDSSTGVAMALYNCGWYISSKKIAKYMLIMMTRSQKPTYISIYGFSAISLATFTTIAKTAWSYFTLMLNVYDP